MTSNKNPFFYLLGGLLVALLVTPIATEDYPRFTGAFLTLTVLIAAFSMSASKRFAIAAWSLVAVKVILTAAGYVQESTALHIAQSIVVFAFFLLATVFSFKRVLQGDYVDMNRIAGAISVYMLIGLIWASMYFFVSLLNPGAFEGLADVSSLEVKLMNAAFMDLLYYSYVTLSTLGYGDITPVSRAAQSLAYLESICGVMFVAVLVAALVGSYGNKRVAQA